MKQRLLAIGVLTGATLLAVSGIELSRTLATLGQFGRAWQMPVTENPSDAVASQDGVDEPLSSGTVNTSAGVSVSAPDVEPPALPATTTIEVPALEPFAAEFRDASGPDDYELRAALKAALVDDLEFFELLDHSDPEIRADVLEFLDEGRAP